MKKSILIILVAFFVIAACSKSSDGGNGGGGGGSTNCNGVPNAFAANVSPTIATSCATDASCHGAGSVNGPGPLQIYSQIFNARVAIKNSVSNGTMPKTGTLSTAQKNSIICWIDGGAPNN